MNWKSVLNRLQEGTTIVSLLANFLLIYLALTKSSKKIGSYKYLMIYLSIFEICFSVIGIFIEPVILAHTSILVVFFNKENSYIPKNICLILLATWGAFFGSFMGLFVLQFVYRYFVAARSIYIKTFENWKIFLWLSVPIICGASWGCSTYFFLPPDSMIDDAMRDVLMEQLGWNIENTIYLGAFLYRNNKNSLLKGIHVLNIIGLISISIILISSIFLIIICAIKCYFKIKVFADVLSGKARNLQYQLFYALVIQATIPLVLLHFPAVLLFLFTALNINSGNFSALFSITTALFPALDPFPVMLIIKNYRNVIFCKAKKIM